MLATAEGTRNERYKKGDCETYNNDDDDDSIENEETPA